MPILPCCLGEIVTLLFKLTFVLWCLPIRENIFVITGTGLKFHSILTCIIFPSFLWPPKFSSFIIKTIKILLLFKARKKPLRKKHSADFFFLPTFIVRSFYQNKHPRNLKESFSISNVLPVLVKILQKMKMLNVSTLLLLGHITLSRKNSIRRPIYFLIWWALRNHVYKIILFFYYWDMHNLCLQKDRKCQLLSLNLSSFSSLMKGIFIINQA